MPEPARPAAIALGLVLAAAAAFPLAKAGLAAAPAAAAPALRAAALVGRWGDNGDCANYIVFRGDGTFLSYTGGEGRWSLSGYQLVMTGANGRFTLRVERADRGRIRITNADGTAGISQRCPTPAR